MASKTIYGTCYDKNNAVTELYLFYAEVKTGEPNVDSNYTPVTVALKVCRNPDYAYAASAYNLTNTVEVKLSIDGAQVFSTETADIDTRNARVWTFTTQSKNVVHAADGSKTVAITASISDVGVGSLSAATLSGSVKLDTIPRGSVITSAANIMLGKLCNIKWTPASVDFGYKLVFSLGEWSYDTGIFYPKQTSQYTFNSMIPLSVAEQFPNAKSGLMQVTLYTYSDGAQIGGASKAYFEVALPQSSSTYPKVTMTLSPVSSLGEAFDGLYIQGKSKVQATIEATGQYGATIESYRIAVGADSYDDPFISDYLNHAGEIAVNGGARDSRGFSNYTESYITVLPYSKPQILAASGESGVVAARCDAEGNFNDGGTYLKIKAKRSYSKVEADGEQHNFCRIRYRYKTAEGSYSSWVTILAKDTLTSDEITTNALLGGALAADTTYLVQVQAIDDVGESSHTTITVPTEKVYWHRDGKRRSFMYGGYVEDDNTFGIAEDITFNTKGPIDAQGGGNVDCLKVGIRLIATEDKPLDLNDLKVAGSYYSPNAETSQYITNSPRANVGGFGLRVRELQNSSYIRQEQFYGRTTWVRHWDGAVWSDWLRYLTTTVDETPVADYVIETGTSGGWTYKRFKGGTYEMFGTFTITPTASTLRDSLYRTDNMTIDLPFTISSAYVSGTAVGYYWITNGGISGNKKITLRLMGTREFDTTTAIEVRLMVFGTYE